MTPLCAFEFFPWSIHGPAEYCANDAEDGSEYCEDHNPDRVEPDWDDRRKDTHFDCE